MQSSYSSTPQYQSNNSYLSRQGNFHDPYMNPTRSTLMTTSTSSTNSGGGGGGGGYQSIIGRRRQTRYDDPNNYFVDNPNVGDGYSSSLFVNSQNSYPMNNQYMNMADEPPAIPPRFRRNEDTIDHYRRRSTDEYLSDNINNNNNNNNSQTLPRNAFIHHAYPATITNATGFRPINMHYNQISSEQEEFHDGAQSTSSTNSSESLIQQRLNHLRNEQRLPPSSINERKPNEQITGNKSSPDHSSSGMMNYFRFISYSNMISSRSNNISR
jgi:hypothetical protein